MDLHSGTPIGSLRNDPPATYPSLDRLIDATVAILGGGGAGALVTRQLAEAGVGCVLIDRRDIASASTALPQYEIDVPRHRLARQVGEIPAARREVASAWCGTSTETPGGLPGRPDVFFALDHRGHEITCSLVMTKIIRDLVVEGGSRDTDLFRFDRPFLS